jgi:opacity protein-like surface antigen
MQRRHRRAGRLKQREVHALDSIITGGAMLYRQLVFPRLIAAALGLLLWQEPALAENVFSVYTGSSNTRDSDLQIRQGGFGTDLAVRDVQWDAKPFNNGAPYYGLRFTHFFEQQPNWGIALDYTHYKMFAKTDRVVAVDGTWRGAALSGSASMNQYVQHFEISHGVNMLSLNGIYRWLNMSWLDGRLQPYAGAGLAYYRPHSENTVGNQSHETGYEPSGFGAQLLAGLQYRLNERWGIFAEVKYNHGTATVDIADGEAETRLRTFHGLIGFNYRF